MRRPGLNYDLFASFARARAERVAELSSGTRRLTMSPITSDPKTPNQVPDGDLSDAVKEGNPTPSDFNDDDDEEDEMGDDEEYEGDD